jgi:hypothetical protein
MVTISASKYKHTENMQTSQGYIFRILQKLFNMQVVDWLYLRTSANSISVLLLLCSTAANV